MRATSPSDVVRASNVIITSLGNVSCPQVGKTETPPPEDKNRPPAPDAGGPSQPAVAVCWSDADGNVRAIKPIDCQRLALGTAHASLETVQTRLLDMAHLDLPTLIANSRKQEQAAESDKAVQQARDREQARQASAAAHKMPAAAPASAAARGDGADDLVIEEAAHGSKEQVPRSVRTPTPQPQVPAALAQHLHSHALLLHTLAALPGGRWWGGRV